jgi:hypothetical protein
MCTFRSIKAKINMTFRLVLFLLKLLFMNKGLVCKRLHRPIRLARFRYLQEKLSHRQGEELRMAPFTLVLFECETWSLTLREERRLWVFENGVLRRIFEPKVDDET